MWLIVGLGNPGGKYAKNRHNIGFKVIEELAKRSAAPKSSLKSKAHISPTSINHERVILVQPTTFMNLSGTPVQALASYFDVDLDHVIVIHDELALELGDVKIKIGGGHAGHNGLRDIGQKLGKDYIRVRAGIGHPGDKSMVSNYVLGNFSKAELEDAEFMIIKCADAVELIVKDGLAKAQLVIHTKKK